jgi:toxin YoeB
MNRKLVWTESAWADYLYWQGEDRKTLKRINKLISDTLRDPFEGLGKPEPLRENLSGLWSRRIDNEYLTIVACRFHY